MQIRIKRTGLIEVPIPRYQTPGSAGFDLCAAIEAPILLRNTDRKLIPTGLIFEIPEGYEGQIRPRSGLALKHGISIVNTPGTLDSDFRGELCIILINHGLYAYTIQPLHRIAQMVITKVEQAEFELVETLSDTERGTGGCGSTGVNV